MKKSPLFTSLLLFFLCAELLPAQVTVSGRVTNAATGAPLSYVNIGVPALAIGTVSDADGNFRLQVPDANQVIAFSAIGYSLVELSARTVLENPSVQLAGKRYALPEVQVVASRFAGEDERFGERNERRGHSVGFGSQQLGTEIGAPIALEGPTYLKSAHFVLNHAQGDSLLFRVNIYDFRDGTVGENLLRENVLIRGRQERGTITVDLTPYELVPDADVLLALEWIRDDEGKGNVGVTFDTAKGKNPRGIYVKQTSLTPFAPLPYQGQRKPCFYFVGVRMK